MPVQLSSDAVLAIHEQVIRAHGGLPGLRGRALLESAVAAPQATFRGESIMTDLIEIAAAYLYYLCSNNPFNDENKRTALASCLVFLSENDALPTEHLDIDEWENLVVKVAASELGRMEATEHMKILLTSHP